MEKSQLEYGLDPPPPRSPDEAAVLTDKPCPKCGYNLRGLQFGGKCPECGSLITRLRSPFIEDSLITTPIPYIVLFNMAFLALAPGALGAFAYPLATLALGFALEPFGLSFGWLVWIGGLVVLHTPRPRPVAMGDRARPGGEWRALRAGAMATQVVGALGALFLAGAHVAGAAGPGSLVADAARVGLLVGLLGLIPTAAWLMRLIDWIPDADRAWSVRATVWALFSALLAWAVASQVKSGGGLVVGMFFLIGAFARGAAVVVAVYLAWSFLQVSRTAGWAVANSRKLRARDENLRRRMAREHEEAKQKLRREEPFGGPLPPY